MFKEKVTEALSKCGPAVRHGAKQAAQGKSGILPAAFAKKGRDAKAEKKRS